MPGGRDDAVQEFLQACEQSGALEPRQLNSWRRPAQSDRRRVPGSPGVAIREKVITAQIL